MLQVCSGSICGDSCLCCPVIDNNVFDMVEFIVTLEYRCVDDNSINSDVDYLNVG